MFNPNAGTNIRNCTPFTTTGRTKLFAGVIYRNLHGRSWPVSSMLVRCRRRQSTRRGRTEECARKGHIWEVLQVDRRERNITIILWSTLSAKRRSSMTFMLEDAQSINEVERFIAIHTLQCTVTWRKWWSLFTTMLSTDVPGRGACGGRNTSRNRRVDLAAERAADVSSALM